MKTKIELERVEEILSFSLKNPNDDLYKLYNFENKYLIDLNPKVTPYNGAYSENNKSIEDLIPLSCTNTNFNMCYKDIALKEFSSIFIKAENILDIGCANGQIINNINSTAMKIAVDIDTKQLFKRKPNVLDSNIDLILLCDAQKLPIKNSSIDVAICCDLLEHLLFPEEILKEAYRVLKPDSKLIITVPNLVSLGNRISVLFGCGKGIEIAQMFKFKSPFVAISGPRFPDQKKHIRWFTSKSLSKFLNSNGFDIVCKFGVGPFISKFKFGRLAYNLGLLTGILATKKK